MWSVALCEAAETMVKLTNKLVDRLLLSEYLGDYEKRRVESHLFTGSLAGIGVIGHGIVAGNISC